MRTTLTPDERAKLTTCKSAFCTCSDARSEKVCRGLVKRGLMKTKPAVSMYSGGAGNVSKPSFKTTPAGLRALAGETIHPESEKQKSARQWANVTKANIKSGKLCEACGEKPVAHGHHKKKRRTNDNTPANRLDLCEDCHALAESSTKRAIAAGLSESSLGKITPVYDRPIGTAGAAL